MEEQKWHWDKGGDCLYSLLAEFEEDEARSHGKRQENKSLVKKKEKCGSLILEVFWKPFAIFIYSCNPHVKRAISTMITLTYFGIGTSLRAQ